VAAKRASSVKTVTLVDPTGREYQSSSPAEINNLVYGAGYKPKDGKRPLAEQVADLSVVESPAGAAVPQASTTTT